MRKFIYLRDGKTCGSHGLDAVYACTLGCSAVKRTLFNALKNRFEDVPAKGAALSKFRLARD